MRDEQTLYLVVWLVLLSGLIIWVPRGCLLLKVSFRRKYSLGSETFGNKRGGLALADLIPWFQNTFLCNRPPILLSSRGIALNNIQSWTNFGRMRISTKAFDYSEIQSIQFKEKDLFINNTKFTSFISAAQAQNFFSVISKARKLNGPKLESLIKRFHYRRMDPNRIRKEWTHYQETSEPLRFSSSFTLAFILFIPFVFMSIGGLLLTIFYCLALCYLTTYYYHKTSKKLNSISDTDNLRNLMTYIFCPPAVITSVKDLSKMQMVHYEPIALAHVLLSENEFLKLSRKIWLDLAYPIFSNSNSNSIVTEARAEYMSSISMFFKQIGLNTEAFEKVHELKSNELFYCPRCHEGFTTDLETCPDCPEVVIKAL